jgi:hypothetical protein
MRREEKEREEKSNGKGREMRVCDVGSAMTKLRTDLS